MNALFSRNKKRFVEHLSQNRLRRIEHREWALWATAVVITRLLTAGLASFLVPLLHSNETWEARWLAKISSAPKRARFAVVRAWRNRS